MMYCNKCGNELKENSKFCNKCGKSITGKSKMQLSVVKEHKKKILLIVSALFVIICVIFIIFLIGKSNLKKELLRDWSRVETGSSGSLYEVELDFSNNEIEYNFISSYSWLNSTMATYDYKVVSKNKIKIKNKMYKIEFNDKKTMMTITPALTSVAKEESWYNTD